MCALRENLGNSSARVGRSMDSPTKANSRMSPDWPTSLVLMGFNEGGLLGDGWHDVECDGRNGVAYRATKRAAVLRVGRPRGARGVFVLLAGSPSLLGRPMRGEISVSAVSVSPGPAPGTRGVPARSLAVSLAEDTWVMRSLPVDGIESGELLVAIAVEVLVVPDRTLRNGDIRGLGFYVSAVWCE